MEEASVPNSPSPFFEPKEARWARYVSIWLGTAVFIGGAVSFLGWLANIPRLTNWDGDGISIQPNTTIAAMAAGATLALVNFGFRRVSIGLSLVVGVLGFTSLFQIATGVDLGVNTIFTFGHEWGRVSVQRPGLMGVPAATSWTVIGTALLLLSIFSQRLHPKDFVAARVAAVALAIIATVVSSLSLIGYMYGAEALYTITTYTAISFQTALFIFMTSIGIVIGIRESGPMRLFADPGPAGILTRKFVPFLVLLPIAIGAVRLAGERAGFYDLPFGSAIRTVVEIFLLLGILWWAGTAISNQARRAEDSQKALKDLADAMPQVVWMADNTGMVEYYNDRAVEFAGIEKVDQNRYDWRPGLHPDDLDSTEKSWNEAVNRKQVYAQEHRIMMADGSFRWHLSRAVPTQASNGNDAKWFGTATDIHDLKIAEHALRESEQRFARFMQNLPGLAWIKDREGRYVFANDTAQAAFGKTSAELYGRTDAEIFAPETAESFVENDRLAMESPHGRQTIESLIDENGKLHYSIVNKFPIPVNGEAALIGGIAIDITDQKIVQDNQEFLFRVADKIRVARNSEDLLADISEELGKFLDLHRCLFNEIDLDADLETVYRDYARSDEHVAGQHKISDYSPLSSEAMSSGQSIVNRDSETDPRTAELFEKTYGPNKEISYIAVPMMREGKWVASLWCSDDKPRDWTNHEITLIENIAERVWVAVERLRSEVVSSKLAAIVQSSDDAIISKDLDGIITSWNHGAEKIFGYTEEEIVGKSVTMLIPEERLGEEPQILDRIRHGDSIDHYETIRRRKDGTLLDISLTVSPIRDADGRIVGASKVARDITERKLADEQIRMISRMPEENPNPVMRVTAGGEILYSNPAAQPVITVWNAAIDGNLPGNLKQSIREAFDRNERTTIEVTARERRFLCDLAPVTEGGYVNVYADDITERKLAEEALRISEDRYRTLFDSMDEGYCIIEVIFDKSGKPVDYLFVEVNRAFEHQAGMRDVVGKRMLEYVSEIEEHWLANYGKVAQTGEAIRFAGEYKGLDRHFEVYAFKIGDGESRRVAVLFTDITQRKEAADALRNSEERYRALTELSPQFVFMSTTDGSITYVNQFVVDFSGRSFDQLLGEGWAECIQPEHRDSEYRKWHRAIANELDYESDVPFLYKDGTYRTVYARAQPVRDENGKVVFWIGTALDVEERRLAADALRESEARSNLAQDAGRVGIWDWDAATGYTFWSDTMWDLYGEEKDPSKLTDDFWNDHIHPEDRGRMQHYLDEVLASKALEYRDEFRIIDGKGDIRWIESRATIVRGEKADPERMYGVNLDATEKKLVEQRIRASETQLKLVTNSIPALISYVDSSERYRFVNNQYGEWFGRPSEDFIGKRVRDTIGARAYATVKPQLDEVFAGSEVSFDTWLDFKAAGQRFVHMSYVPDLAADGKVIGYYGLVNDLSELKRSEELLRASQERMRLLTESFTDYAIMSMDNEGKIDSWNPGAAAIFGYKENEIIGESSEVLFTPGDVAAGVLRKSMRDARKIGRSSDERWLVRKDGSRFFASGVTVPLYVGRVLSGYAKIASDLTERKRSAEELQRAHDEMELRVLERTRELAEANAALRAEISERAAAEEQKIALLKRLVTSQEDERRRIARDLHDQLGQRLTALRLKIASLRELVVHDEELKERTNRLQEIGEMLDAEVSFLAWELRPSAVEELGLVDAIGTFAREWSRHYGIPAEFHSTGMASLELDSEADTHLYRIAQEALNNIVKHANAKRVNILVERTGDEVILIVEDDGRGFERTDAKRTKKTSKGLGLTGMQERASLIGGKLEIESVQGTGTTIFARIPLRSNGTHNKK